MTTPIPADDVDPDAAKRPPLGVAVMCPHCGTRAHIRTSRQVTETYREGWAICTGCGFKGKIHTAWDAEVSPSMLPNPRVSLPRMAYRDAVDQFLADTLGSGKPQMDMFANTC